MGKSLIKAAKLMVSRQVKKPRTFSFLKQCLGFLGRKTITNQDFAKFFKDECVFREENLFNSLFEQTCYREGTLHEL